jgi:hypothetical protein
VTRAEEEATVLLLDRVRNSLDEIGYLQAASTETGYFLDEPASGIVRLRWGYERDGMLIPVREPDDWVNMCADYLLSDGFNVRPDDQATDVCGAVLIETHPLRDAPDRTTRAGS